MPTITLPQVGKSASPATIRRWRKQAGQPVAQGEVLLEVETDEGLAEIEAPAAGQLSEVLVRAGQTVPVGAKLAVLSAGAPAVTPPAATQAPAATPAKGSAPMATPPAVPAGKVVPLVMPKAGNSMEEGTLVKWRVQPGAPIKIGDIVFEIETDKATMEVEATDSGRLARIVLPEGGTCKVLEPVAYLADRDADVDAFLAAQGGAAMAGATAPGSGLPASAAPESPKSLADKPPVAPSAALSDTGRVKASPAARKLAAERGIDLAAAAGAIAGTGPGGRILSTDVPLHAPVAAAAPRAAAEAAAPAQPAPEGATRKRMSQMRKAIARNLSLSKQTIPHFYVRGSIDAAPLVAFYQGEKAKYPCSINDVIVAACARVLMEFPAFRSRIDGDDVVEYPAANIGVAVGLEQGLVVPVILNADKLALPQIGAETKRLAALARGGKIEGMGQGVFTITNLGMFGVEEFSAIINPPEAAILAVGTTKEEVIVSGGTLRPGKVMRMTLSADHRVIDGMLAGKFMARLKEALEYPQQLL